MFSSKNKKQSSGLRILWIPGRKKHGHKGRYDSTRNQIDYSRGKQKQNEPWSLGGSKGTEELVKAEIPIEQGATSIVLSSTSAIATVSLSQQDMKLEEEESNKFAVLDTLEKGKPDEQEKEDHSKEEHIHNEEQKGYFKDPEKQNGSYQINNDRKDYKAQQVQDDVNSIQPAVADNNLIDEKFNTDRTDGSIYNAVTKKNNHKKKNKKKKNKNKNKLDNGDLEKEEDEDSVVTCLYYTLMCCECSIS